MQIFKLTLTAMLCLCLLFCAAGCGTQSEGEASSAPSDSAAGTVPTVNTQALYFSACKKLSGADGLTLRYVYDQSRTVAGEIFTENRAGTALYSDPGSDEMEAMISENLTYGSYSSQYIESYISGSGYCRVSNRSFTCGMTAEAFLALQIPAQLLDAALYGSITAQTTDGATVLFFEAPSALESWATNNPYAEMVCAKGSTTIDTDGKLVCAEYHAEFIISAASYTLDVSVSIEDTAPADLSTQQPVYPEDCTALSDLQIPRYLLRVVGDVYTADAMTATYTDTLSSAAYSMIRTQTGSCNTYGSGGQFLAAIDTQVTLTDYNGSSTKNSQRISYADGVFTSSINGGAPTADESVTAQQMRAQCEDSILSALLQLDYIAEATLNDTGDFLCITCTGTEDFAATLCTNIYTLFGINLDTFAESYQHEAVGSYLTINKHTGLPTAMGLFLNRSHVIGGVTYSLAYQLDQSIELPSSSALENITGQNYAADVPAEAATPLFYKVTGKDGQSMWLLGTTDLGDSRTASLPKAITDAFATSDALAVEYDLDAFDEALLADTELQNQIVVAYYYSSGTTVSDMLPESLYSRAYPLLLATGCNSTSSASMKVIIWKSLIETLFQQQSYSLTPEQSMEQRLLDWARQQDKAIYEIESGLAQVQALTGFSAELQSTLLELLLDKGLIPYCQEQQEFYELWCQGDEEALTQAVSYDTSTLTEEEISLFDEYYKGMCADRNSSILKAAKNYLKSGETVFCAVGISHLFGNDGLIQSLRDAGYIVEKVS